jgi:magnesium-transporting ATPase (P-type)
VYDHGANQFELKKWRDIQAGEFVKVLKDEEFPADLVLLKSDKDTGIVFVDTMNLDGEVSHNLI